MKFKTKPRRRVTLFQAFVFASIIAMLVTMVAGIIIGCDADWQRAERSAGEFASKVPGATGKVSCMKMDSDQDGYCRCTIFKAKGDPLYVECGCNKYCVFCKEGCSGISHKVKARGR